RICYGLRVTGYGLVWRHNEGAANTSTNNHLLLHRQGPLHITNHIRHVLQPYAHPHETIRYSCCCSLRAGQYRVRREARLAHQGVHPIETWSMGHELQPAKHSHCGITTTLYLDRQHRSESIHRLLREFMIRMAGEPGVVYPRNLRVVLRPLCKGHRVLVLPLHANIQRLQPALQQPACKRVRCLPPYDHLLANLVNVRGAPHHYTAEYVVMPVKELGRGLDHYVRTVFQRSEIDRARKGGVHNERHALLTREAAEGLHVYYTTCRIHRAFHENHTSIVAHGASPFAWCVRVNRRYLDAEGGELFVKEPVGAAVDPLAGYQVVAGPQQGHERARCCTHPACKHQCCLAPFEHRDTALNQLRVRRVRVPRVAEVIASADLLQEVYGLHER